LGFLGSGQNAAENPIYRYWILLDFFGFSRLNQDFSMGYTAKSKKEIFSPFLSVRRALGREAGRSCAGAELFMRAA
jgi:hypothetical protein